MQNLYFQSSLSVRIRHSCMHSCAREAILAIRNLFSSPNSSPLPLSPGQESSMHALTKPLLALQPGYLSLRPFLQTKTKTAMTEIPLQVLRTLDRCEPQMLLPETESSSKRAELKYCHHQSSIAATALDLRQYS